MARKPTDTVQLKLRFSEALRRRLAREAKQKEHSLNAEIIGRLDQSFQKAREADLFFDAFRAAFGGPTGDLLRAVATAIWLIEKRTGKKWNEDYDTAAEVDEAMLALRQAFAAPLNAEQAFRQFRAANEELQQIDARRVAQGLPAFEFLPSRVSGSKAALEALQKMGLAPSDAEIDKVAKKHAQTKTKGTS